MVAFMNVEAEILDLKRRVGDLEGALSVLTGQLRAVHPEIVALKESTGQHLERMAGAVARVDQRLEGVEVQVWSLRDDLPEIVRAAVDRGLKGGTAP